MSHKNIKVNVLTKSIPVEKFCDWVATGALMYAYIEDPEVAEVCFQQFLSLAGRLAWEYTGNTFGEKENDDFTALFYRFRRDMGLETFQLTETIQ